ncbi:MAG: hypothetical protein IJJ33_17045, partial [Victivallales bacterium]|nr:hypothetical protein [Victivallales bacterium]
IEELKKLIATLADDSPLRARLEAALKSEEERLADECPKTEEAQSEEAKSEKNGRAFRDVPHQDLIECLIAKIDDLTQNDEFVSGVAGFILGAAAVGLGALAFDAIKGK